MISPPEIWDGVLRRLGVELPTHTLAAWVAPLGVESANGGLRLLCPSRFHRDRIHDRLLPLIERCAAAEAGEPVALELGVAPTRPDSAAGPAQPEPTVPAADPNRRERARPAQRAFPYTFDSFVVGPCNALAREASLAVARGRQQAANPLFLVSTPGHGKTHLARAICAEAKAAGRARVLYAPAEGFTNESSTRWSTCSTRACAWSSPATGCPPGSPNWTCD
jgi:chromosomal replication initiator protein